jgi:DHA3 family macrolide efflux protein-like MFS transporter
MQGCRLLLSRDFGLVWWGQLISQIGDSVTKLALLWFVYSITGSALKTTIIGVLQTIPPIAFGPLIGVYLDRLPKKPILITADILRALLIGVLPCTLSVESFTVEYLYVIVFLHAIATAVFGPALTASVPSLVPRSQFTAANALLQGTTSLGLIIGPVLSGIGIAAFSSQAVLCVNAVTYLVSAACLLPVRLAQPSIPVQIRPSFTRDLMEGVRFAFMRQRTILLLIVTAALYSFGTSAFSTLFPVFGRKILDLGPVEVGYLWSALGVGLLIVSVGLVKLTAWDLNARMVGIAAASVISGVAMCLFVWAPNRVVATLLMGVIGGGLGVFTPIAWGALQELSPDHLVSRALTLYGASAMTAAIIGMTVFGWLTERFGVRASLFGIAFMLFATGLVAASLRRGMQTRPTLRLVEPSVRTVAAHASICQSV